MIEIILAVILGVIIISITMAVISGLTNFIKRVSSATKKGTGNIFKRTGRGILSTFKASKNQKTLRLIKADVKDKLEKDYLHQLTVKESDIWKGKRAQVIVAKRILKKAKKDKKKK